MTDKAATVPERTLHRKLAQVMHEVGRIPKNGTAPREMGGYKFVQVGDAADAIRKALADLLITMMPVGIQVVGQADRPTKSGGSMTTVDLIQTWRLTDAESGESIDIQSFGAGADGGDKYSGKASTSAMKYALLTGFLLSTGEDSELGNTPERAPVPEQDGDFLEPAPPPKPKYEETEEIIGRLGKSGTVKKGTSEAYKLDFRPSPDDKHSIGFRLEVDGDRAIPQVLCEGDVAEALYLVYGERPDELLGQRVTVKGRLFNVKSLGRTTYYRLKVQEITTPEMAYPAPEPAELPSAPFSPDEEAAIAAAVDAAPAGTAA